MFQRLLRLFTAPEAPPAPDRSNIATVVVQIICGDCGGDSLIPHKTHLTVKGRCDECGGASFVLASELAINQLVARRKAARRSQTRLHAVK